MEPLYAHIEAGVLRGLPLEAIREALPMPASAVAFYRAVRALVRAGRIPNVLLCYCGHDCGRCKAFAATLDDDAALRAQVCAYYATEMRRTLAPESVYCLSGRSDVLMAGCADCPFMRCCREKGLSSCADCPQAPCGMLDWYQRTYVNRANQLPE